MNEKVAIIVLVLFVVVFVCIQYWDSGVGGVGVGSRVGSGSGDDDRRQSPTVCQSSQCTSTRFITSNFTTNRHVDDRGRTCQLHVFTSGEAHDILRGKWVAFVGDSHLRAVWMTSMNLLDREQRGIVDNRAWFNMTASDFRPITTWPDWVHDAGNVCHADMRYRSGVATHKHAGTDACDGGKKSNVTVGVLGYASRPCDECVRVTFNNIRYPGQVMDNLRDVFTNNGSHASSDGFHQPDVIVFGSGAWSWTTEGFDSVFQAYAQHARSVRGMANKQQPHFVYLTRNNDAAVSQAYLSHEARVLSTSPRLDILNRSLLIDAYDGQMFSNHYSNVINAWDTQRLLNAIAAKAGRRFCDEAPTRAVIPRHCYAKAYRGKPWKSNWAHSCTFDRVVGRHI